MRESDLARADQLAMIRQMGPALDIIDAALAEDPDDVEAMLLRIKVLRLYGHRDDAMAAADRAEAILVRADNQKARAELAFQRGCVLIGMKKLEQALEYLLEAAESDHSQADYLDSLCATLGLLGRPDEAAQYRHQILQMRDAEVICAPEDVITAGRPQPFDPTRSERNIVSYCLFGDDAYYHECAITNARVTPIMFPEFKARFYCAPDVPEKVLKALKAARSQVMIWRQPDGAMPSHIAGKFWRFLAFDDPDVDVVLCRDVDSPILLRERAAIDMWLTGNAPFYCLRDNPMHAALILAGLWGGFTRVLPPLGPLVGEFVATDHSPVADQKFLRTVIWPRVRDHAIMAIDSIPSLEGSVDFPESVPRHRHQHVGGAWPRSQILGGA